jgi:tetratricopeptide (TPR) repeat protein
MKTCIIYANCQTRLLINYLKKSEDFNKNYKIINIPLVQELLKTQKVIADEVISQVDLFIYQPVRKEHGDLSSEYTLNRLPSKAISISFPSLYFKGYHPQECKNSCVHQKNLLYPWGMFPHGDTNIISLLKQGKTEKEIIKLISDENFYGNLSLISNVNSTLEEMRKREHEFNIDIQVSDFIQDNYKKHYLFYTPQHPSDVMGVYIVNQILSVLGFPIIDAHFIERQQEKVGILDTFQLPIYPSVVKNLELTFCSSEELYKNSYFCKQMNFREYVNQYIKYYDFNSNLSQAVIYHFLSINSEIDDKIENAINYQNQAISLNQDQTFLYERLGYLQEKITNYTESAFAYKKAIELSPEWSNFHFSLGKVLLKQVNLEDAIAAFQKAINARVKDSNTRKHLRNVVLQVYSELIPIDYLKLSHQSYKNLANLLYRLGYYDQAKIVLNSLIELQPSDCLSYVEFGKMLQRQGILNDETKFYFQKAIDLNPRSLPAHIGLATYFQAQGLIEEAINEYEIAYKVSPTRGGGYPELQLSKLYAKKGDAEVALLWHEKYLCYLSGTNLITCKMR